MSSPTVKQQMWRWLVVLGVLAWVGYQIHALIEAPGQTSFVSEWGATVSRTCRRAVG